MWRKGLSAASSLHDPIFMSPMMCRINCRPTPAWNSCTPSADYGITWKKSAVLNRRRPAQTKKKEENDRPRLAQREGEAMRAAHFRAMYTHFKRLFAQIVLGATRASLGPLRTSDTLGWVKRKGRPARSSPTDLAGVARKQTQPTRKRHAGGRDEKTRLLASPNETLAQT